MVTLILNINGKYIKYMGENITNLLHRFQNNNSRIFAVSIMIFAIVKGSSYVYNTYIRLYFLSAKRNANSTTGVFAFVARFENLMYIDVRDGACWWTGGIKAI